MTCQIKNGKEYPIMWMRLPNNEDEDGDDKRKEVEDKSGNGGGFPISTGPNLLFKNKRYFSFRKVCGRLLLLSCYMRTLFNARNYGM